MKRYFVLTVLFLVACAGHGRGQIRESDEGRLSQPEPGAAPSAENAFGAARPNRELTCVAGRDGKWFTADDIIMHFFIAEYDDLENMVRKSRLKPGPDAAAGTPDDQLQEYHSMEYLRKGRPGRQRVYSGPGPDKEWFTGDDVLKYEASFEFDRRGNKVKEVRRDPSGKETGYVLFSYDEKKRLVRDVEYSSSGPDGSWFTGDDPVLKYHTRDYAADGRLLRAREYHADHQGKGPDGVWFSGDDVVSSTREFVWGKDRKVRKTLKAIGAGPDGAWFTPDDVLQYYTLREYGCTLDDGESFAEDIL